MSMNHFGRPASVNFENSLYFIVTYLVIGFRDIQGYNVNSIPFELKYGKLLLFLVYKL